MTLSRLSLSFRRSMSNLVKPGVTQCGDLAKFKTPEELDEAVEDITVDDARKLLKLYAFRPPLIGSLCDLRFYFFVVSLSISVLSSRSPSAGSSLTRLARSLLRSVGRSVQVLRAHEGSERKEGGGGCQAHDDQLVHVAEE